MSRKRYSTEQLIRKLCEAEVEISKGATIAQVVRKLGITDQTYYGSTEISGSTRPSA
jgi:putative transposase